MSSFLKRWLPRHLLPLLLMLPNPRLGAQEEVRVPSEPLCDECSIRLDLLVSMGELDGPGAIGRPVTVARNRRFQYFVVSEEMRQEISVFDRDGRFEKTMGRRGEGPGEYRDISALLVLPGDSLLVFDQGNARIGVLSPEGEWVRGFRYPGTANSVSGTREGLLGIAGLVADPDRAGYPVHFLGMEGAFGSSFGMDPPAYRPDMVYFLMRFLSQAREGGVWVAHHIEYVIEHRAVDGSLQKTLLRDADWFEPQFTQRNFTKDTQCYPSIFSINEDSLGRLWVVIRVNEPDWWLGLGDEVQGPEGPVFPILDIDQVYGTRLEVLDPGRGRVVVDTYSDELIIGFLKGGDLVSYGEGDGGVPRLSVWRASVQQHGGR